LKSISIYYVKNIGTFFPVPYCFLSRYRAQGRRRTAERENKMRKLFVPALFVLGVLGLSTAGTFAAPTGGAAIGNAAASNSPVEQVYWRHGYYGRGWGWRGGPIVVGGPVCAFGWHRVCGPYRCWRACN
jgi:hypothetical protein